MKFTKKVQYGLMFCFYLARNGRSTVEAAANHLGVSYDFLSQIANKLRKGVVIKAVRGPGGGYELVPGTTTSGILTTLGSKSLLTDAEIETCLRGGEEHRELLKITNSIERAIVQASIRSVSATVTPTTHYGTVSCE